MVRVMTKHGVESDPNNLLGKPISDHEKKCALTKALRLAHNCHQKLNGIRDDLQTLCCEVNQTQKQLLLPVAGEGPQAVPGNHSGVAVIAGHLVTLIGEAEAIAKRIYETAVGLHIAEDYLRQPDDVKLLDFSTSGRIQIPNYNFNHASQLCLEWLHSTACKWLRDFQEESKGVETTQKFLVIFENFTKAVKDYTVAVCLANQVFRVLLYPNNYGKESLQEYVLSLGHVQKNDVIMEVQALRRAFDNIQCTFERLGWTASIVWMKYSGKEVTLETLTETGMRVDQSTFQCKLYEAPAKKIKPEFKKTTGKGKASKQTIKSSATSVLTEGESSVGDLLISAGLSIPSGDSAIGTVGKVGGGNIPKNSQKSRMAKIAAQVSQLEDILSVSRKSRSTPDVVKTKKVLKKSAKGKKARDDNNNILPMSAGAPSTFESQTASPPPSIPSRVTKSNQSQALSRNNAASISMPLTLRRQFNAVFGLLDMASPTPRIAQTPVKRRGEKKNRTAELGGTR